jgi:hypothetical protein
MKTNVSRIVCFAFAVLMMNAVATKAQSAYYDVKRENGRMVSKTKYVEGNSGMHVKESVAKYTYSENGDFLKKEVYVWNQTYAWDKKTGREYPDYSEGNWTPQYRVECIKNAENNYVSVKLSIWDREEKAYKAPKETMTYQLNATNRLNYLAFQKGDESVKVIDNINTDTTLLAGLSK